MGLSIQHLVLTLAIVILIFGTKRLKNVGSDIGDAIKGFRKAINEGEEKANLESDASLIAGKVIQHENEQV